ncbi:unnamed protein product [Chrysoparadoxa australica]
MNGSLSIVHGQDQESRDEALEPHQVTFAFEKRLPKLPIPPLGDTLDRYLEAVEPLLEPSAYQETCKAVEDFRDNEGPKLQVALQEYSRDKDSYVEEFWDESYLTPQGSVVLNLNPFFVFEDAPTQSGMAQGKRAASLVFSSLRFIAALRSNSLAPDVFRGTPLDMSQYRRLFGAARIPSDGSDQMVIAEDSRHIVVLCRNRFYYFNVLDLDGSVGLSELDLAANFSAILEDAEETRGDPACLVGSAVGVLTAEHRKEWAAQRSRLADISPENEECLGKVDQALFVLCLDHNSPAEGAEVAASCLHGSYELDGDVQTGSLTNRWYDKLQLIVFANGRSGLNFEHTGVDGHTVLRFVSDVFSDVIYRFANSITELPSIPSLAFTSLSSLFLSLALSSQDLTSPTALSGFLPGPLKIAKRCGDSHPRKIQWDLDDQLRRSIYLAETRLSDMISQHSVRTLSFDTYGKAFIVKHKMSPDAFVQMALAVGYYSLYGRLPCIYEAVQTKRFAHGRTEGLRSCTKQLMHFVKTYCDPAAAASDKLQSLRDAITQHVHLVKLAAQGLGVDRHMFALSCVAEKMGLDPDLFKDKGWITLNRSVLSTSNCGNPSLGQFGFGPVVREGFGLGYIIKDDCLKICAVSKQRQTQRFLVKVEQFLEGIADSLDHTSPVSSAKVLPPSRTRQDSGSLAEYSMWGSLRQHSFSNQLP